jgi:hypothetical protein
MSNDSFAAGGGVRGWMNPNGRLEVSTVSTAGTIIKWVNFVLLLDSECYERDSYLFWEGSGTSRPPPPLKHTHQINISFRFVTVHVSHIHIRIVL